MTQALIGVLLLARVALAAPEPFIPPVDCKSDPISCVLAKLESKTRKLFYGTSILFDVDENYFWFLTSAHLMPRSPEDRTALRIRTPLLGYSVTEMDIVGEARGVDIAVFRVRRNGRDEYRTGGMTKKAREFFGDGSLDNKALKLSLMGIPGVPGKYHEVRPAEAAWLWVEKDRELTPLTVEKNCPPPFLSSCYRVPLLSWGFSGGALTAKIAGARTILGVISHFAPLGGITYAVPMATALATAEAIQEKRGDLVENPDGYFRIVNSSEMEILQGDLRGKRIRAPGAPWFAEGGDESSGGGDESSGGGPEGVERCVRNAKGNIATLGDFSRIDSAASSPRSWGDRGNELGLYFPYLYPFKGVRSLLTYRPGVLIEGSLAHAWNETTLGNIQQFINAYRDSNGKGSPRWEARPFPFPATLQSTGQQEMGLFSLASLRRFKELAEMRAMNGRFTRNDVGFELRDELSEQIEAHAKGGVDLIIGQVSQEGHYGPLIAGKMADNELELQAADDSKMTVRFSGGWQALGDRFYRREGTVWVREFGESTERPAQASLSLQWNPIQNQYEFRGVWAFSQPEETQEPGGFLSRDHWHLRAVSLNLSGK